MRKNETLFHRTVMSDPARFIPILYDPTVAGVCLAFGHISAAFADEVDRLLKLS